MKPEALHHHPLVRQEFWIPMAGSGTDGYLSAGDWASFTGRLAYVEVCAPGSTNPACGPAEGQVPVAPLSGLGTVSSPLGMRQADATHGGWLSATDWAAFNAKAPSSGGGAYVQNQVGALQAASFRIDGTAEVGTSLSVPVVLDRADPAYYVDPAGSVGGVSATLAGKVGIGTSTPGASLDVAGGNVRTSGRFVTTEATLSPLVVSSSTVVSNLNADLLDGSHASAFLTAGCAGCVGTGEIANGSLTDADVASGAAIAFGKLSGVAAAGHTHASADLSDGSNVALLGRTQTFTGANTFQLPIVSSVVTGTAPLAVSSTTLVANLNAEMVGGKRASDLLQVGASLDADKLDGQHGSFYAAASGGGGYVQNQIAEAQAANFWITGSGVAGTLSAIDGRFSGKVGVGTGSPFSTLQVSRPVTNTISTVDGTNTAGLVVAGNDSLVRLQLGVAGPSLGPWGGWIQASYDNAGAGNGTEPLLLNPLGGRIGIGTAIPETAVDIRRGDLQVLSETAGVSHLFVRKFSSTNPYDRGDVGFYKARGTFASPAAVAAGDHLWSIEGSGFDGAQWDYGGGIYMTTSGVAGGVVETALAFDTASQGASTGATRMLLDKDGRLGIATSSPTSLLHVQTAASGVHSEIKIFKNTGADSDKAALTLGYNDAASLSIYRTRAGGIYHFSSAESGADFRFQVTNANYSFSGGKVGIGTTTPFSTLQVSRPVTNTIGTADGSNSAGLTIAGTDSLVRLQLGVAGASLGPYAGWIQASYDNGGGANGTEPLLLNPLGGNVGIGTTAPEGRLELSKPQENAHWDALRIDYAGSWSTIMGRHANVLFTDGVNRVAAIGATYDGLGRIDFHSFYNGGSGSDGNIVMTVRGDGKVGIGTTAPAEKLELSGTAPALRLTDTNVSGDAYNIVNNSGYFRIQEAGVATRMQIDGSGNFDIGGNGLFVNPSAFKVGIGTTSPANMFGMSIPLNISRPESGVRLDCFLDSTATVQPTVQHYGGMAIGWLGGGVNALVVGTDSATPVRIRTSGTDRVTVTSSGSVGIGTMNPSYALDVAGDVNLTGALRRNGVDFGLQTGLVRVSRNQYGNIDGSGNRTGWSNNTGVSWTVYRYIYTGTVWTSRDAEEKEILAAMGMSGVQHFQPSPMIVARVTWGSALSWVTFPNQIRMVGTYTLASYCKSVSGNVLDGYWASGMTTSWKLCGGHAGPYAPGDYMHAHPSSAGPGSALVIWPAVVSGYFPLDPANPKWGYWDNLPTD
jgi:hypothetical protein